MGAETERLEQLLEASYALHESLDLDELLGRILAVASKGVGADRGTVFVLDEEKGRLWSHVLSGDELQEISLPVVFAVLTTVAAFTPLLYVPGSMGKIMRTIPLIVIPCLVFSLIESLLILPAHLSHQKHEKPKETAWRKFQSYFTRGMQASGF